MTVGIGEKTVHQTRDGEIVAASNAAAKDAAPAMLLGRIKDRILKMEIMGDDKPEDLAEFMAKNIEMLRAISNGSCIAPEREAVLRWSGDKSTYLTFTEHLNNVAIVFADICSLVRPIIQKEKSEGELVSQAEVIDRALALTKQVCAEVMSGQEAATPVRN